MMKNYIAFVFLSGCMFAGSCRQDSAPLSVPDNTGIGPIRLVLTADVMSGTVPLTVNFTGTLYGFIDTLALKVPETTFTGGYNPEEEIYAPLPDTVTPARRSYSAREHYFRQNSFKAVMKLHGVHRDIISDTVTIDVR